MQYATIASRSSAASDGSADTGSSGPTCAALVQMRANAGGSRRRCGPTVGEQMTLSTTSQPTSPELKTKHSTAGAKIK